MNEFHALKNDNYKLIKLYRNDHTKINHATETDLDDLNDSYWDYIIYNNDALNLLEEKVKNIAKQV
jgi:hypothetical protein